jgi:hypothetical protein
MLTANKWIWMILLVINALPSTAQTPDTVNSRPFERYWTRTRVIPKFGGGYQGNGFVEAGLALHKIYVHPLTLASAGPYLTCDVVFTDDEVIVGPKAGYEVTAGLFGFAADVAYYSDFEKESLLITPKLGITLLGFADLFYGRSFTISQDSFSAISVSRFSLIINLNPDYFDLRDARRKRR